MFERIPSAYKLAMLIGVLLAGPVTLFAFMLGGATGGAVVLIVLALAFVVLYMITVRKFG